MDSREQPAPDRPAGEGGAREMGERLDQAGHSAEHAWSRTRERFTDVRDTVDLRGRVERNPYGTLAAALGVGYVLGGGLFTPLTGRIVGLGLRIGLRLAVLPLLTDEIATIAESLRDGATGRRREAAPGDTESDKPT